jgi:glutathione peroxidase
MIMHLSLLTALSLVVASCSSTSDTGAQKTSAPAEPTLHSLKVETLEGKPADLANYRGKVLLVVNVASKCGNTPQYAGLESLYKELAPRGLVILGFPSNDFGGQEPGTPAEIEAFCTEKYGVTFPMFAKVQTKLGPEQSPVYAYLGEKTGKLPEWNFAKYLVGKDGKPIKFYASKTKPNDPDLRAAIDGALLAP